MNNHLDDPVILMNCYIFSPQVDETKRQLPPETRVDKARCNQHTLPAKR